jgi:CheY-like chemotaxis protein
VQQDGAPVLHDESVMRPAVLIVEDDPDLRSMMDQLLHWAGFAPVSAINGLDALRLLKSGLRVDAILLDLMMPVMDGRAFRERQLQDPELAEIPVVVFSAYQDVAATANQLGVAGYLAKPVDLNRLLHMIRQACSRG